MKADDRLNQIFLQLERVVLSRQHPVTGLLPASTAVNNHGNYTDAWVRDNVYSVMCVWALGLAYQKRGEKHRADQLRQATIKLMRGLLQSMMRQSNKVERFKRSLNPLDALHAKYSTTTGLPVVADDAWGHLQIDATSLFLLMLGQMSASGLRIVTTSSEVDFVQNLMYYIASAYRTPDFGIWERGNKINNGKTEINASSVGMAKAALQALDGFNLFGKNATPRAVIHTIPDAISHARATLASLLPRESQSKEVDAALLSIIGFPAFAVGDENLVNRTRDKILQELGGRYGCKRFIWDGHQTAIEDHTRLYYEHTELANFENIESEWPLFFAFLYVDALCHGNEATASHYRQKLEDLMVEQEGVGLIPELYYLPQERVAAEKKLPDSQERVPNENVPLVWAQSLYWVGLLIDEGFLDAKDIDRLKMRQRSTRFVQPQVALVVLAEDDEVKEQLISHGVISETLDEARPLRLLSARHLMEAYGQLGANDALELSGRPHRRLQGLTTSQTYDINGDRYLCLSWIQSDDDDYRGFDARRLAHKIEQEFSLIQKHWLNTEVAVFTFLVEKRTVNLPDAEHLFSMLRSYQLKTQDDRIGYASAKLAYRASRSHQFFLPGLCITPWHNARVYGALTLEQCLPDSLVPAAKQFIETYTKGKTDEREAADRQNETRVQQLLKAFTIDDSVTEATTKFSVRELLELVYRSACQDNHWLTARRCFALLGKSQTLLSDSVVLLESRHLSVVLANKVPLNPSSNRREIAAQIAASTHSQLEATLTQELIVIVGALVRTHAKFFDGLRSIYVNHLLDLCSECESESDRLYELASLSPYMFLERLLKILEAQEALFSRGLTFDLDQTLQGDELAQSAERAQAIDTDWLEWRSQRGLITRFDEKFLAELWASLRHVKIVIFGDSASEECALDTEGVTRSMTPGEVSFAQTIDHYTQLLHPPYFKSAVVEVLQVFARYCSEHPSADFGEKLDLGNVLEKAADRYVAYAGETDLTARSIDTFIEQSPLEVQRHVKAIVEELDHGAGKAEPENDAN